MTTGISDMNQKISANEGHIHKNINPYPECIHSDCGDGEW